MTQQQLPTVIITGGSSGLGFAIAKRCIERANVVLLARNVDKLQQAQTQLQQAQTQQTKTRVEVFAVDVSDPDAIATTMQQIQQKMGRIDTLINSAGILEENYFEQLPNAVFERVMKINFFGTLNTIRAALPYLKQAKQPRIMNIASVAGLTGVFGYAAYSSSKHALVGLTRTLYTELKPQGITVQLVCPGEFDSPMVDDLNQSRTPENNANTLLIPKSSVDLVANAAFNALNSNTFMVVPGLVPNMMVRAMAWFPAISRWMANQAVKKVYRGPQANS